jgi:hypothetical protein
MDEQTDIIGNPEWAGQTMVHPVGFASVLLLGIALLLLPRRWAVLPMLIIACFIPSAQRIVILGMDFNFLRIMVVFGFFRLLFRREYKSFTWSSLDTAIVLWGLSAMTIYVFREGSFSAFVNRLGFGFDAFGMYFLFRCLVQNWQDVTTVIYGIILISLPVALFFVIENRTGRNMFSIFGGVPEITAEREGRLRCQGPYSHAILAGCFWAALLPLMAAFWWKSAKDKLGAIIGVLAALLIVGCCASSTPVMGVLGAVGGGLMFYFRRYMRPIRWGVVLMVFALHLMMKAPVWHLISRVSAVGGSTGWHRFKLIDETIKHFDQWWLLGTSGQTVLSWGVWKGDITNQYILEGLQGGFLTFFLFIIVIAIAFGYVGKLWRRHAANPYRLALSWALGVSLFVHCLNFIGVSYFGQIHILWYLLLAAIASLTAIRSRPLPAIRTVISRTPLEYQQGLFPKT